MSTALIMLLLWRMALLEIPGAFPPKRFLTSVPFPSRPFLTPFSSRSYVINFLFDGFSEVCERRARPDSALLECQDRWTSRLQHSRWRGRSPPGTTLTSRWVAGSNKDMLDAGQRSRRNWLVQWQDAQIWVMCRKSTGGVRFCCMTITMH